MSSLSIEKSTTAYSSSLSLRLTFLTNTTQIRLILPSCFCLCAQNDEFRIRARPLPFGGHDVAEAQAAQLALILVDGTPDVLAVCVVQKTVDGLRDGGVVDEARYEVVPRARNRLVGRRGSICVPRSMKYSSSLP
jgi:hypothetical protein